MDFNWKSLEGIGSLLGGAGALYGAYNQAKMGKELLNLQQSAYKDELKRKKRSQARLDLAANEVWGHDSDSAKLPIQY